MKLASLALAAALSIGTFVSIPANAQPGPPPGHDRQELRGDRQELRGDRQQLRRDRQQLRADRHDLRGDRGELRHDRRVVQRHRGWTQGHHYGWRNRDRHCRVIVRHHHRTRICRTR
jgi:hypothetical protein